MKETRAALAAKALAVALSAMIDLMYQNDTAFRFIKALKVEIDKEFEVRSKRTRVKNRFQEI
jgi:hypothetical protein